MIKIMENIDNFKNSRLYFSELTDALIHYSKLPGFKLDTITVRSSLDHEPRITTVSETNFPALDDISIHSENLMYAADKLDFLPSSYWESIDPLRKNERPDYIAAQIIGWGTVNKNDDYSAIRKSFLPTLRDRNLFTHMANLYSESLKRFAWLESDHPDFERDGAEQSCRILHAYIVLHERFKENGLPKGIVGLDDFLLPE